MSKRRRDWLPYFAIWRWEAEMFFPLFRFWRWPLWGWGLAISLALIAIHALLRFQPY